MSAYRHLYRLPRTLVQLSAVRPSRNVPGAPIISPNLSFREDGIRCNSSSSSNVTAAFGATEPINPESAVRVVAKLSNSERDALRQALQKFGDSSMAISQQLEDSANTVPAPSGADIRKLMLVNSVPFIGFGFLDNFFMIIAGDYIESTLGVYMCLSTMAAAGLGNTISDVLGLGLAHYVEQFCVFVGLHPPQLTAEQIDSPRCRRAMTYGRSIGIIIGCLLGMFPLYFMNKKVTSKVDTVAVAAGAVEAK